MGPSRDLFANFERMRREMDQLFGDIWDRAYTPHEAGFSPRVDVYYADGPPRAVVKVDLAGVSLEGVAIELDGRVLTISGERPVQESEGRTYQCVEIEAGPFRREVELSAEVVGEAARATYDDGILRVELPLRTGGSEPRQVPISAPPDRSDS